jgi:hypothetical protein
LIIAEESIDNKQLGGVSVLVLVYYQKGPEIEIIKCNVQKKPELQLKLTSFPRIHSMIEISKKKKRRKKVFIFF